MYRRFVKVERYEKGHTKFYLDETEIVETDVVDDIDLDSDNMLDFLKKNNLVKKENVGYGQAWTVEYYQIYKNGEERFRCLSRIFVTKDDLELPVYTEKELSEMPLDALISAAEDKKNRIAAFLEMKNRKLFEIENFETEELMLFVQNRSDWSQPFVTDALIVLCKRAGEKIWNDWKNGDEKQKSKCEAFGKEFFGVFDLSDYGTKEEAVHDAAEKLKDPYSCEQSLARLAEIVFSILE